MLAATADCGENFCAHRASGQEGRNFGSSGKWASMLEPKELINDMNPERQQG